MVSGPTRAAASAAVAATLALLAAPAIAQAPAAGPGDPVAASSAPLASPAPSPVDMLDPATPLAAMPDLGIDWPDPSRDAAATTAAAAPRAELRRYRVSIQGIEPLGGGVRAQFNQLSALVTGEGKPANTAQLDRRARDDEALMAQILRAEGRYDGNVATTVVTERGETIVHIAVDPGAAYVFSTVTLDGLDPAGDRAAMLREEFSVHAGDPVGAERVNAAVASFRAQLGREGYPFATAADPAIVVDHANHRATLALAVTLGARAKFGKIVEVGERPPFDAAHLAVIARFRPGDPYDSARLEDFRRALIATSLVSLATITPVPSSDPGIVDIRVEIGRAPPRTLAGELGYGTGEGVRAEASWQHRNLLPPEGAVTFRGVLGTREQSLSALLRRSNFHARDRVLTAQVAAAHSNFNAYNARTLTFSAGLERQSNIIWQKTWTWSFGGEFVASDERDTIEATGQPRRRTFLVAAAPGSLTYDGSDDLLNPTRGFRLGGRISPEASLQKTFDGYVKLQLDASGYLPIGTRLVLAGRVRVAAIQGAPRDVIAPSRRLYAGGGGSVRGYGYQKIGPTDVDGTPIGGRGLTEAAIEARIRLGNFGVVPFLDTGNLYAASIPKITHLRYGTGLGARYYSSFGPIRVDVGTPIARRPGESRLAVYVSLGQAF